jgi:predicted membrane channel-forming protein YqfA (hemolysin III family)
VSKRACCRGRNHRAREPFTRTHESGNESMNGIIYLVGLVVVIVAILSFFGLR